MRNVLLALLIGTAACTSGVAYSPTGYGYGYNYEPAPDLVSIGPGVQVIANYNVPIFYSNGYYWRNYGGHWYRSYSYRGGWHAAYPPRAVLGVRRPGAYAYYRPYGYVPRHPARGYYRNGRYYEHRPDQRYRTYDQRYYNQQRYQYRDYRR